VRVYEFHARVALQSGDLNEYNQCQTQLKQLYALLRGHSSGAEATENETEFVAYRILYYVYLQYNQTSSQTVSNDLSALLATLGLGSRAAQAKVPPAIRHALQVRQALLTASGAFNYNRFFTRLYAQTPNLGRYILGMLLPQLRFQGLLRLVRGYRPTVELGFVLDQLGFPVDAAGVVEGLAFVTRAGVVASLAADGVAPAGSKERKLLARLLDPAREAPPPEQVRALWVCAKDSTLSSDFLAKSEQLL
jgi:hypothetical protein